MIQTINISLIPSDNKPVINVSQFDNVSRVLRFNVFDDLGMETPHVFDDGDTVLLNIRKNDNNIVVITGVIVSDIDPETQEVTGQYLTFELTEQACACVGSNFGEVSITSGDDEVIGSCNFKLIVERSPLAGGISSQTAIDNLTTQIEQITEEVIGDNYYDKEEIDGKFDELDIPTKTSQLTNDSGFITASDIPTIPTKTSQLTNDSGFITASDIPTIPTKTSQLTNDSGFTTIDDTATANDKTWSSDKISDELYALLPVGSASGSIANFNTVLAKPLVSCDVDENATKLYQFGSNLFDIATKEDNKALVWSNGNTFNNPQSVASDFIKVKPNSSYSSNYKCQWIVFDSNKNYVGNVNARGEIITTSGNDVNLISIPDGYDITYLKVGFRSSENGGIDFTLLTDMCISIGSVAKYSVYKYNEYDLPLTEIPNTYLGDNNFFTDYGDITVQYKDTIQNYIDTRVNTVSNRSLSMMRTLETLETIEPIERGDNNDDNAR